MGITDSTGKFFVRPVAMADLDALLALAKKSGPGMTNLPADKELLTKKIQQSLTSFEKSVSQPKDELYIFVLTKKNDARIFGCSAIDAKPGHDYPFYSYKIVRETFTSEQLNARFDRDVLMLVNDYHKASELCMLYLDESLQKSGLGRLLSKARLFYMANNPERFGKTIIAEMRGQIDDMGHSPFWTGIATHFFSIPFLEADKLSACGSKQFISDLMPKHPIYISLLPQDTRATIGKVHPKTKAAVKVLEAEGFYYDHYIDIFDGGPTLECQLSQIKTIQNSLLGKAEITEDSVTTAAILSNLSNKLIVIYALISVSNQSVNISPETAQKLCVQSGDDIRYLVI